MTHCCSSTDCSSPQIHTWCFYCLYLYTDYPDTVLRSWDDWKSCLIKLVGFNSLFLFETDEKGTFPFKAIAHLSTFRYSNGLREERIHLDTVWEWKERENDRGGADSKRQRESRKDESQLLAAAERRRLRHQTGLCWWRRAGGAARLTQSSHCTAATAPASPTSPMRIHCWAFEKGAGRAMPCAWFLLHSAERGPTHPSTYLYVNGIKDESIISLSCNLRLSFLATRCTKGKIIHRHISSEPPAT